MQITVGEEARPGLAVLQDDALGVDRVERELAIDDVLVDVRLALGDGHREAEIARVFTQEPDRLERDGFVERGERAEHADLRGSAGRGLVDEDDLVVGVVRVERRAAEHVDDREPPRLGRGRRVAGAAQVLGAEVQEIQVVFLNDAYRHFASSPGQAPRARFSRCRGRRPRSRSRGSRCRPSWAGHASGRRWRRCQCRCRQRSD